MKSTFWSVFRFGLVEIGVVRYSQLSREQRQDMLEQERANMVMFDVNRRMPETTDATPGPSPPRTSTAAVSSSALPNPNSSNPYVLGEPSAAEGAEEEEPVTEDEMEALQHQLLWIGYSNTVEITKTNAWQWRNGRTHQSYKLL